MAISPVTITTQPTQESAGGCGCGGCGCGGGGASAQVDAAQGTEAGVTATYAVDGMTCGHCVSAVTQEVSAIEGVTSVDVVLVADGTSTVTVASEAPLDDEAVRAAVEEAGYVLVAGR